MEQVIAGFLCPTGNVVELIPVEGFERGFQSFEFFAKPELQGPCIRVLPSLGHKVFEVTGF